MIVVLATGVFDAFHPGHLAHLKAAAKFGDQLIVAITKDEYVNKGPNRPIYNQWDRRAMVKALYCVDWAFLVKDSFEALKTIEPDIFAKGIEYKKNLIERDYCLKHGIKMVFISPRPAIRTSKLWPR